MWSIKEREGKIINQLACCFFFVLKFTKFTNQFSYKLLFITLTSHRTRESHI